MTKTAICPPPLPTSATLCGSDNLCLFDSPRSTILIFQLKVILWNTCVVVAHEYFPIFVLHKPFINRKSYQLSASMASNLNILDKPIVWSSILMSFHQIREEICVASLHKLVLNVSVYTGFSRKLMGSM